MNLVLVLGTLIGGWALIGVLVNVTHSWSTITGAKWGWVAVVFVLAQAAYPALAVTTVGSVTDTLPYGRTVALNWRLVGAPTASAIKWRTTMSTPACRRR